MSSTRITAIAAVALLAATATGCASHKQLTTAAPHASAATSSSTAVSPSPTKTAPAAPANAKAVIMSLADAGLPAKLTVTYTAKTDPNGRLGTPDSYQSKAAFTDHNVNSNDVTDNSKGSVDVGGGVEVFESPALATGRANYILGVEKASGGMFLVEHDIVSGSVLLRLSGGLPASSINAYKDGLAKIMGQPATEVKV